MPAGPVQSRFAAPPLCEIVVTTVALVFGTTGGSGGVNNACPASLLHAIVGAALAGDANATLEHSTAPTTSNPTRRLVIPTPLVAPWEMMPVGRPNCTKSPRADARPAPESRSY